MSAWQVLFQAVRTHRVAHAYLFSGFDLLEKTRACMWLVKVLDAHLIRPGEWDSEDETPKWKICVVHTDSLSVESQHLYAQLLDAPPPYVVFLFITSCSSKVHPVLAARTQHLEFAGGA